MLDALIQDCPFLLVNIYLPTKPAEQLEFFNKLQITFRSKLTKTRIQSNNTLVMWAWDACVLGGDFNATFDPEEERDPP